MSKSQENASPAGTLAGTLARLETARTALAQARRNLMDAELMALSARYRLETVEADSAAALLLATAAAEGANETQRKARAHEATAAEREATAAARREWYFAEERLTRAKSYLRLADDERRTVETLLALWQGGLLPLDASRPADRPRHETEIPF